MDTGIYTAVMIVVGVLLLIGVSAGLVWGIMLLASNLFGGRGSLGRLEQSYPAANAPKRQSYAGQTMQIGAIIYQRCITLAVEEQGLYVARGNKRALIPWNEFKAVGQVTLHWNQVPLLTVGDPPVATMTVPNPIFELMRSHLSLSEQAPKDAQYA